MYYSENKIGKIEVICGPMFAGKTEELIRRVKRMDYAHKNYLVFKPNIDNRYANDEVVSHNKKSAKAINIDINNPNEIKKYIKDDINTLVFDEVQFYDPSFIDLVNEYSKMGLRIICAGLDKDFTGKPFGIMPELLAVADEITKLTAICVKCGEEATETQRMVNNEPAYIDDPTVLIGATESYEARCRRCHEVRIHE